MSKKKKTIISGQFNKHIRGFGFVKINDTDEIYIAKANTKGAMNGDIVQVDLLPDYLWEERPEGIITNVLERAVKTLVGTFEDHKTYGFVVSDEKAIKDDIFIKGENIGRARDKDKVLVEITKYPEKKNKAEGKIVEIVAKASDSEGQIKALVRAKGIKEEFSEEVLKEAQSFAEPGDEEAKGREDYRNMMVFTIDGADSKDFDDAVSIEKTKDGGYLLYVHIADVTHYVKEGGALDLEALKRGNSIYLPNKVIPMLPKELSNGICSLNPGVDRLTITCIMEINAHGEIVAHDIKKSIVNSKFRLVYNDVSDILEKKNESLIKKYADIYEDLLLMEELTKILRKKRKEIGGLDFDLPEAKISLDKNNKPVKVELEDRRIANILIEEFMLAANRTIAEHFYWMNVPFVYRVHEKPDQDRMLELKSFLAMFGIGLKGKTDNIHPNTLSKIMDDISGEECETIINTVILRSMKKAFYATECMGHFGLAYPYYCHFTSPIRRYPDLMIHRIIKKIIDGEDVARFASICEEAAKQSSDTEKKAQELERDVEKMFKAEYILNFKNRKFEGVISGVTEYGVYVELENTIEGMARLDSFKDDFYIYDPKRYRVIGENTRNVYALGQKVLIRVKGASPAARQIDFDIIKKL